MKKVFRNSPIVLAAALLLLATACKKEEPESFTLPVTKLSKTGATLNGTVNPNGLSTIVTFEYGTTTSYDSTVTAFESPVTGDNITNVSAAISGLIIGTIYHYRVKAENSHWTLYSSDNEFEYGYPPTVATLELTNLKSTGATLNGAVNAMGLSTIVTFEFGTTTSYGMEVTPGQNLLSGKSISNVSADISGLIIGNTYHFRAKAENSFEKVYGSDKEFEFGYPPSVTTLEATNLKSTSTTLNGTVNARGLPTIVTFEYGTTASFEKELTLEQNPVTGNSITNISADISGLTLCATYHFRLKAENSFGTSYGSVMTLFTSGPPTLTTKPISGRTGTTAESGGNIVSDGCPSAPITERGVIYWPYRRPQFTRTTLDGTGTGSYTSNLTGLSPSSIYFVKAYAKNIAGIAYGNVISFATSSQ
jgi:hypothetical protein